MSDTILGFLGKLVDNTSKLLIIAGILVCIILVHLVTFLLELKSPYA